MKFYKVVRDNVYDYLTGYTTIKNELLTEKERARKFKAVSGSCFQPVEVSRKKTYWLFGARFEMD